MKILLIKPREKTDSMAPPLGLGYLAAALDRRHEVRIVDGILQRLSPHHMAPLLQGFQPDIVGFTLHTFQRELVREYLLEVRGQLPKAVTVVGGPHPSADPNGPLQEYGRLLDYVFVGEAEKGFADLVQLLEESNKLPSDPLLKKIPGLVFREQSSGRIIKNKVWIADPESIGVPRWDLLSPLSYPARPPGAFFKQSPTAPVSISRGCPNPCTFCAVSTISGRNIRYRPIVSVIEEWKMLHDKFGIVEFHIMDDNLTYQREYVLKFCEKLRRELPGVSWTCPNGVRIDTLDDQVLSAMKASGCYTLSVGIEAGDQATLDALCKNISIDQIRKVVARIKSHGLSVKGFFILGFPGQTPEQMDRTIAFSKELPLDMALFSLYHPFPGTRMYRQLKKDRHTGRIRESAATLAEVAYVPQGMTPEQLKAIQRKAFLSFWLRPRILWFLIRQFRTPEQLFFVLQRMVRWLISR